MTTLEIVPGGKLLAKYEDRPIREIGKISAVNASINQSLGLGSRGFIEKDDEMVEVFSFDEAILAKYSLQRIHYNIALINRNPNNDEACSSLKEEQGMTVLLSKKYPAEHPALGFLSIYGHNLGHLQGYEHLFKNCSNGTKIIRVPFGRYRFIDQFDYKYAPIGLMPRMSVYPDQVRNIYIPEPDDIFDEIDEDEVFADETFTTGVDTPSDFLARDYAFNFRRHLIPLDYSWVARIEGDNGSIWQNPFYSTTGLPIFNRPWDR